MEFIFDSNDKVIHQSKNLLGVLTYARTHSVSRVSISPYFNSAKGHLYIGFANGAWTHTTFQSFAVLQHWIRTRKALQGAYLVIDGHSRGVVTRDHPGLLKLYDTRTT